VRVAGGQGGRSAAEGGGRVPPTAPQGTPLRQVRERCRESEGDERKTEGEREKDPASERKIERELEKDTASVCERASEREGERERQRERARAPLPAQLSCLSAEAARSKFLNPQPWTG